jgi:hypothetical protein
LIKRQGCLEGSNAKRPERHVNATFDEFVDDNTNMRDYNLDSVSIGYRDRFW